MKIGIIVDGREEQNTLNTIVSKINIEKTQIVTPLYASIAPKATPLQIAKAMESRVKILCNRGVDKIVVAIDLEDLNECPGVRAISVQNACLELGYKNVEVVIKNRKFENWLIADIENLKGIKSYTVSTALEAKLQNADSIKDAVQELHQIKGKNKYYHKTKDATALAKNISPERMAQCSRSFRKFLKILGHEKYCKQK